MELLMLRILLTALHPYHSFSSVRNMIKQENPAVRRSTVRTLECLQDGMQLI